MFVRHSAKINPPCEPAVIFCSIPYEYIARPLLYTTRNNNEVSKCPRTFTMTSHVTQGRIPQRGNMETRSNYEKAQNLNFVTRKFVGHKLDWLCSMSLTNINFLDNCTTDRQKYGKHRKHV